MNQFSHPHGLRHHTIAPHQETSSLYIVEEALQSLNQEGRRWCRRRIFLIHLKYLHLTDTRPITLRSQRPTANHLRPRVPDRRLQDQTGKVTSLPRPFLPKGR